MGNIKDIYNVGKDAAYSVKKAKKPTGDFKKLIKKMIYLPLVFPTIY